MEKRVLSDFYKLGETLGSGGFSTVRTGTRIGTGEIVAVKTLEKTKRGKSALNLIRNEIMIMAHILERLKDHPNVIKLLDVFDEKSAVHLVLEVCAGGELFEHIVDRGHYSEQDAARLVRQISTGLDALHSVGVLHRDLKPENLLFSDASEGSCLKIMDFGLSLIKGTEDAMTGLCGSLDYFAPESLSRHTFCEASDCWALGVILYILLSGYPPFYAESSRAKQQVIVRGEYDFDDEAWDTVSEEAKDLIRRLLVVDPAARLTAAQVLEHVWVREGGAARREARPEAVTSRIQKFDARRKFRAAAYACMVGNSLAAGRSHSLAAAVPTSSALSQAELTTITTQFRKLSPDGRSITYMHFEQVMQGCNLGALPNMRRVFEVFDADSSGTIDLRELICGIASLRSDLDDSSLMFCFKVFDADGNGTISRDELGAMLRTIATEDYTNVLKAEALGDLFEAMDLDNNGSVSFSEFKQTILAKPYLVQGILDLARSDISASPADKTDGPSTSQSVA